jgi:hypothetical protein
MAVSLVEQIRELGIGMGSLAFGRHVGWTTDEGKANAARELGATLREYRSADPTCTGWEVSCVMEP